MIDVTDYVAVVGPQSSGTRLVARIIRCGGFEVWHDKSHGRVPLLANKVVVVTRDPTITLLSRDRNIDDAAARIPRDESIAGARRYTAALWITYEDVCADLTGTVRQLADYLDVDPWDVDEVVVEQNSKWLSPNPAPQIDEGAPV